MTSTALHGGSRAEEPPHDNYDPNRGRSFNPGHQDLVTNISYNLFGSRMVTASSDHRIKAWDLNKHSKKFDLVDTWKAHDAEVLEVFSHATYPQPIPASSVADKSHIGKMDITMDRSSYWLNRRRHAFQNMDGGQQCCHELGPPLHLCLHLLQPKQYSIFFSLIQNSSRD
jgi:WD40 repeat protein